MFFLFLPPLPFFYSLLPLFFTLFLLFFYSFLLFFSSVFFLFFFLLFFSSFFLVQSASDFFEALRLDPSNKDLESHLKKSKDKYLEVEGKGEWNENTCDDESPYYEAFTVVPMIIEEGEEQLFLDFMPRNNCEFLAGGRYLCGDIVRDSGSKVGRGGLKRGEGVKEGQNEGGKGAREGTVEVGDSGEEGTAFTRVAITFDDDSDEEEEDEEGREANVEGGTRMKIEIVNEEDEEDEDQGFTRIQITDEDDDDEGDEDDNNGGEGGEGGVKGAAGGGEGGGEGGGGGGEEIATEAKATDRLKGISNVVEKASKPSESDGNVVSEFTRISIEDDDDEDDENVLEEVKADKVENEVIVKVVEKVLEATPVVDLTKAAIQREQKDAKPLNKTEKEHAKELDISQRSDALKTAGNDAMKSLSFQEAVRLYTESLAIDPSNVLTRNNRSQVRLFFLPFSLFFHLFYTSFFTSFFTFFLLFFPPSCFIFKRFLLFLPSVLMY